MAGLDHAPLVRCVRTPNEEDENEDEEDEDGDDKDEDQDSGEDSRVLV